MSLPVISIMVRVCGLFEVESDGRIFKNLLRLFNNGEATKIMHVIEYYRDQLNLCEELQNGDSYEIMQIIAPDEILVFCQELKFIFFNLY